MCRLARPCMHSLFRVALANLVSEQASNMPMTSNHASQMCKLTSRPLPTHIITNISSSVCVYVCAQFCVCTVLCVVKYTYGQTQVHVRTNMTLSKLHTASLRSCMVEGYSVALHLIYMLRTFTSYVSDCIMQNGHE